MQSTFQSQAQLCIEASCTGRDGRKAEWRQNRNAQKTTFQEVADKLKEDRA
jgi:hypothetical protein